jgi:hypothetical protein
MTSDSFEIIAAFVDGERVDTDALKLALGDAAGRDYLADIVSLRDAVRLPDPAMTAVAPASVNARRWLAAAALVVVGLGTGFAIGHRVALADASVSAAPAPNRVIELKPGVNWHETGGGLR